MNKYSTLIGIIISLALVIVSIFMSGDIKGYIDVGSILIVVGGTIGTTLMVFNVDKLKGLISIFKIAFLKSDLDRVEEIYQVLSIANNARKGGGLISIQSEIEKIEDPFLLKGLNLVMDNTDPQVLQNILTKEIESTGIRHQYGQDILNFMADASPAFGNFSLPS